MQGHRSSFIGTSNHISPFSIAILMMLIVISEVPILLRNVPNLLFYGLVGLFIFLNISIYIYTSNAKKMILLFSVAYYVYGLVLKLIGISTAALSYYSTTTRYLFMAITLLCIFDWLTEPQRITLFAVTVLAICYTLADNIRLYRIYGSTKYVYLFRTDRFTSNGVHTVYISALFFISGVLFIAFLRLKKLLPRLICLIVCIALLVFSIGITQRALILILSVAMFPLLVLFNARNNIKVTVGCIATILLGLIIILFYQELLGLISRVVSSERLQDRIREMIGMFTGETNGSTASGASRIELWMTSIRTFTSSPVAFLFGAGDHRETNDIVGNHSQILDEFARHGLVGAFFMLGMLFVSLREAVVISNPKNDTRLKRMTSIIMAFVFIRGLLGNIIEPTIAIAVFFVIPMIMRHVNVQGGAQC